MNTSNESLQELLTILSMTGGTLKMWSNLGMLNIQLRIKNRQAARAIPLIQIRTANFDVLSETIKSIVKDMTTEEPAS